MPEMRPRTTSPAVEPMLSLAGIVELTGLSRSTIERLRAAGKLPKPDLEACRSPRWKGETIRHWIDGDHAKGVRR